mmetsp:Transcript_7719/g.25597  ORF Transcript_7719/g.25597 Transcript_7719/m.25597 type:complete len:378 (+) Transcript_7719:24-1157(+)|eukprot:CAMPEP_0170132946 /NCGR_PEP_ID=MMETSP0033_2-20121228/970_1 /TAXON_ID=195969 /ORGANISM="Dolichomastix tenuilepis, Strain CCMP3274" /LENGTH=377 /DNA_ID=CAMNT_0010368395 /DNA_START=7 /DNA_END=1140 /DNA_ORIENTATION=+
MASFVRHLSQARGRLWGKADDPEDWESDVAGDEYEDFDADESDADEGVFETRGSELESDGRKRGREEEPKNPRSSAAPAAGPGGAVAEAEVGEAGRKRGRAEEEEVSAAKTRLFAYASQEEACAAWDAAAALLGFGNACGKTTRSALRPVAEPAPAWTARYTHGGKLEVLGRFSNACEAGRRLDHEDEKQKELRLARQFDDARVAAEEEAHAAQESTATAVAATTTATTTATKVKSYHGVSFNKAAGRWQARILYRDKVHSLGYFASDREAALAWDLEARKQGRQKFNFPREGEVGFEKRAANKFRGVCFHKGMRKWQAQITRNGTRYALGYFDKEEMAARIWDVEAARLGRSDLNFPLDIETSRRIGASLIEKVPN